METTTILTGTCILGNGHPQSTGDCVNRRAISFERSVAILQRIIPQVRTEVPQIPSDVSAYSLRLFRGRFMEVCTLPHGSSRKTYAANLRNSIANL